MGTTHAPTPAYHLLLLSASANDSWQRMERQFLRMEPWRNFISTPMPSRTIWRWNLGLSNILADIRAQRYPCSHLKGILFVIAI